MPSSKQNDETRAKQGKYATLPESQCAICAENASDATLVDPARVLRTFVTLPTNQADPTDGPSSHPLHNPYETTCGHIYCYQCIAERIMRTADEAESHLGWECLRCGEFVKEAHRYRTEYPGGDINGSEYDFSSDPDFSTNFSGSTYTFSETGFSE